MRPETFRRLILGSVISIVCAFSLFGQSLRERSVKVTVTDDKGGVAAGLKSDWFKITENKLPLQITGFERSDEPASVAVLADFSTSISAESKQAYVNVVSQLIRSANTGNEYLVVGFDQEINVIAGWGIDLRNIETQLTAAAHRRLKNGTVLYDACSFALTQLESRKRAAHVMVVLSDGADNSSKLTFPKLREQLKESSTTLYAVVVIPHSESALGIEGQGVLDELSSVSGGNSYYPNSPKEMLLISDQIGLELRYVYRITFKRPSLTRDNKWHTIKIKLNLPEKDDKGNKFAHLNVRSRLGYYDQ